MKEKIEALFLDYVNNFLTVSRFAEYYFDCDEVKAQRVIDIGRRLNYRRPSKYN